MGEKSLLTEKVPEYFLEESNSILMVLVSDLGEEYLAEIPIPEEGGWSIDLTPFMPNTSPYSLSKFYNELSDLVQWKQEKEGVLESRQIKVAAWYPAEEMASLGEEVITYRLLRREPGSMAPDGESRRQHRSSPQYNLNSADEPNKVIIVESRPVDHTIEISCWSKTNNLAESRAMWLENLLHDNGWQFQVSGAERFRWQYREADGYQVIKDQRLFCKPLRYHMRYREFTVKASPSIKQFNFEIKVK